MRALGWSLIALGAVFGLATAGMVRSGLIVDRSIRVSRAKDPREFRNGIRFFGCYSTGLVLVGIGLLAIA